MHILISSKSKQGFVWKTEMQNGVPSVARLLQRRMRMGAVPVQKMLIILMEGPTRRRNRGGQRNIMYVLCKYIYVCEHTLYVPSVYAYVPICTDFQSSCMFSSMTILKTSKPWPTWRIIRMSLCVSCVSMLVLAIYNTMRPCSRTWTSILYLNLRLQTSMRWNVLLWLTVIWTCCASLGFAFLH